jgi:cytochrome c oxidase accessory protein FixG
MSVHLPVVPNGDEPLKGSLKSDGTRAWVQPADVSGRYAHRRKLVFALLIAWWAALPWVKIAGHPAVFIDVEHRLFYLFGATFNAQDIWLVFFLLTGVAWALAYMTALWGRVWCGWACPQTVFLEGVFRRVERLIEGPRNERIKRDAGPPSVDRFLRKSAKHALFIVLAFLVAHIFVAYFVSLPRLYAMVRQRPSEHPEAFAWAIGLTGILYFNFSWFREQLCLVICPYGRLQSLLQDQDSVTIGYDVARGEPRGKAKKSADGAPLGDCVDCHRCVAVCPTGIDIRNGMQLDCVACSACVDACDEVMEKLQRPKGLIRYDSLQGLSGGARRVLRTRIYLYTGLGILGLVVMTLSVRRRVEFEANLLRLRGAPFTIEGGSVRNAFELHLVNKNDKTSTFDIEAEPVANANVILSMKTVTVAPLAATDVPFFVIVPRASAVPSAPLTVHVRAHDGKSEIIARGSVLGPSGVN